MFHYISKNIDKYKFAFDRKRKSKLQTSHKMWLNTSESPFRSRSELFLYCLLCDTGPNVSRRQIESDPKGIESLEMGHDPTRSKLTFDPQKIRGRPAFDPTLRNFFWPEGQNLKNLMYLGKNFQIQTQTINGWPDLTRATKNWPDLTRATKNWSDLTQPGPKFLFQTHH